MIDLKKINIAAEYIKNNCSADDYTIRISARETLDTRFAQNAVTQHISGDNLSVQLQVAYGNKTGSASINQIENSYLDKLIDDASNIAKANEPDSEFVKSEYQIKRPGSYTFCMEPKPYWEPAEDCFIIHYTKTIVAAFGDDDGWDSELGLKTEIVPLSKPFGLYAGNVFQGIVKLDGKPVPYAEVEVEYYNIGKKTTAPTDYMVTQTIKADQNGVFTYAAPPPLQDGGSLLL